jgi:hypothetical protein
MIMITVITDTLVNTGQPNYKIARRLPRIHSPLDNAPHGEHGLAYQIETVISGESHSCLFDFGADPLFSYSFRIISARLARKGERKIYEEG